MLSGTDAISEKSLYVPPAGETRLMPRLMPVTFPPDSVMMRRNKNDKPVKMAFVLIGVRRDG